MIYDECLYSIQSINNFNIPASLDRIKSILKIFDNPQDTFPSIHIAGTNGKGSVCALTAKIFQSAGYKTGMFISPFIIDFRERIQINGEYISKEMLIRYFKLVQSTNITLTQFEFITAMAFLYFRDQKCNIVIVETGLGGRLDATNAIKDPRVSVITKVGIDHMKILGDTIDKIAEEKCGIIKTGPVVSSPNQNPEVFSIIKSHTSDLYVPDISSVNKLFSDYTGSSFLYKSKKYHVALCGDFQIENAITAIEAVLHSGFYISDSAIEYGLSHTFFPARMEVISKNPLIILDGAHNPDGASVLSSEIMKLPSKPIAIIGMMKDKDYCSVLKLVLPHCERAIALKVEGMNRSLSAESLCEAANKYCFCSCCSDYDQALKEISAFEGKIPIIIFGSLYLAGGIRNKLIEKYKNF